MKTMKTTVPYNFRKVLAGIMLVSVPVFVACEKDPVEPNENGGNGGNGGNTQPQRIEEFIYNANMEFYRSGSSTHIPHTAFGDTAAKYGNDGNVKQIHITPESPKMCETLPGSAMQTRANFLDGINTQSKNKLSGENTTLYLDSEALSNQTVQTVLNGKLKIALIQR